MSDVFLLDADSLIRSKREHYAADFCPGFWDALLKGHNEGRVFSVGPVKAELQRGKDHLAEWVDAVPSDFFKSAEQTRVQKEYARIAKAVQDSNKYKQGPKANFLRGADPWVIACAYTFDQVVVSYEVPNPSTKLVKIPDVAKWFGVKCVRPFVMLRELQIQLTLDGQDPNWHDI